MDFGRLWISINNTFGKNWIWVLMGIGIWGIHGQTFRVGYGYTQSIPIHDLALLLKFGPSL